jgi:hypothetical protein
MKACCSHPILTVYIRLNAESHQEVSVNYPRGGVGVAPHFDKLEDRWLRHSKPGENTNNISYFQAVLYVLMIIYQETQVDHAPSKSQE